jgi:hypothetical protein
VWVRVRVRVKELLGVRDRVRVRISIILSVRPGSSVSVRVMIKFMVRIKFRC